MFDQIKLSSAERETPETYAKPHPRVYQQMPFFFQFYL